MIAHANAAVAVFARRVPRPCPKISLSANTVVLLSNGQYVNEQIFRDVMITLTNDASLDAPGARR